MSRCEGDAISELPNSLPFTGSELFVFVQDGMTRQGSLSSIASYLSGYMLSEQEVLALSGPWDETYGVVILSGGADRWNSNYNLTNLLSAAWESTYNTVEQYKADWNDDLEAIDELRSLSGKWEDSSTTVQNYSAIWAESTDFSLVQQTSSSWHSTYNTVSSLSAGWNQNTIDQINAVLGLSANWQTTYTTTKNNSANWESAYDSVVCKSWDDEFITIGITNNVLDIKAGDSIKIRSPYKIDLTEVRASVGAAPAGDDIIIDIKASGLSIFNSPLVIDANKKTSVTSQPYTFNTRASFVDNEEITIEVLQAGSSQTGRGLNVTLIGNRHGCIDNPPPFNEFKITNKPLTAPSTFVVGDVIQFKTTVVNTGGDSATNILVTNSLQPYITITQDTGNLTAGAGALGPDESAEIFYEYEVRQVDVDNWANNADPLISISTVTGTSFPTNTSKCEVENFSGDDLLLVAKAVDTYTSGAGTGINGFAAGDKIYYDVTVTNNTAVTIHNVTLTDSLSPDIVVVSDSHNIMQSGVDIASGNTVDVKYYYIVTQNDIDNYNNTTTPISNVASVQYNQGEAESNTVEFTNLDVPVVVPSNDVIYIESNSSSGYINTLGGTNTANGFNYSFTNTLPVVSVHNTGIQYSPSDPSSPYNTQRDAVYTTIARIPDNSGSPRVAWVWPATNETSGVVGNLTHLVIESSSLTTLDVANNTALEYINCENNSLANLDITNNNALTALFCSSNSISNIDTSNNPSLLSLNVSDNNLSSLDLSNNTILKTLRLSNNSFNTLDLTNNNSLEILVIDNNSLSNINLTLKTSLKFLSLISNSITSLDISSNTLLERLFCSFNDLNTLDLTNNTNLLEIFCEDISVNTIDVTNALQLEALHCSYNNISGIDTSNNLSLKTLRCDNNSLTSIDVTSNTDLEVLVCNDNNLSTIDISNNTQLDRFICSRNNLTSLNVSNNNLITYLVFTETPLSSIDLSNLTILEQLFCEDNSLTSLNLSSNNSIHTVDCSYNSISTLDISNCIEMRYLYANNNNITAINATNWIGSPDECRWDNNQLTTDAIYNALDQAGAADPLNPTLINISNNPASSGGVLQDGVIYTASDLEALVTSKNYALQLT